MGQQAAIHAEVGWVHGLQNSVWLLSGGFFGSGYPVVWLIYLPKSKLIAHWVGCAENFSFSPNCILLCRKIATMDLCSFVAPKSSCGTPYHRWFLASSVSGKLLTLTSINQNLTTSHLSMNAFDTSPDTSVCFVSHHFSLYLKKGVLGIHFGFMDLGILTGYRRHLRVSVEWRMPLRCVLAEGSTELAWLAKARLYY